MAQILIRDLSARAVARLKRRAKSNGRSLQAEVREILDDAVRYDVTQPWRAAKRIRALFNGQKFPNSADLIREDRDR